MEIRAFIENATTPPHPGCGEQSSPHCLDLITKCHLHITINQIIMIDVFQVLY